MYFNIPKQLMLKVIENCLNPCNLSFSVIWGNLGSSPWTEITSAVMWNFVTSLFISCWMMFLSRSFDCFFMSHGQVSYSNMHCWSLWEALLSLAGWLSLTVCSVVSIWFSIIGHHIISTLLKDVDTQFVVSKTLPLDLADINSCKLFCRDFQHDGCLAYMPKQQDKKLRDSSWSVDLWDG